MSALRFSIENGKLVNGQGIFSLPAGWSCPFAKECFARADKTTGKITTGDDTRFRCFAATGESWSKGARSMRWENFNALKAARTSSAMAKLISASLPDASLIRIHASGDFYSQAYFDAWIAVARSRPDVTFYAYTKAVVFWIKRMGSIPANLRLVASFGGTHDRLIVEHKLKSAVVVNYQWQADAMGLAVDHDDSHAFSDSPLSFALLIHGTQAAGSPEAKAWSVQRAAKREAKLALAA